MTLPGVGRKTANLVRAVAFRKPAICVDTHVHRVTRRLGLIPDKTSREKAHVLLEELGRPPIGREAGSQI